MGPVIGILMRYQENENKTPYEYVFDQTRQAIIRMGGEPLLLCPPQDISYYHIKQEDYPMLTEKEKESIRYWLNFCDGLFLPGGNKISPFDFFVLEEALKRKIPILGVCLGMQILANYHTSFQLDDVENLSLHSNHVHEYAHEVTLKEDSLLFQILEQKVFPVNSNHVKQVRPNPLFHIVAVSSDGVIEAIEMKDYPFCIGVQWHPENMIDFDPLMKKLFQAFLLKAKEKEVILK